MRLRLSLLLPLLFRVLFERQRYPLPIYIHLKDRGHDLLVDLYDLIRVFYEPVGEPAHMRQSVLVHADIDKSAEGTSRPEKKSLSGLLYCICIMLPCERRLPFV